MRVFLIILDGVGMGALVGRATGVALKLGMAFVIAVLSLWSFMGGSGS